MPKAVRNDEPERRCLEILRDIGDAVLWEADPFGLRFSFVSDAAEALLGIPASDWQGARGFLREHVHPEDWCSVSDALYRAAVGGSVQTCEHRMLRADGTMVRVRTSVRASAAQDGAPVVHGITMAMGTAGRSQAVNGLHRSEEQFRLLVESVQDYAVFMVSPEGRIESWNRGAQRLKGYRAHEIMGASIVGFFPPEEVAKDTPGRLIEQAGLSGTATYEGWLLRKGGSQFWGVMTLSAVEDERGHLVGFSNVARDLTERRRTEEALRESEERFRRFVESVQDYGMFMVTPDGRVAGWNPGAARLKGYQAQEIIGAHVAVFFPPEEVERGTPARLLERAASKGAADYEGWLVRKDGSMFWASLTLDRVTDDEGNPRGFSNVSKDITERMRAERAQVFLSEAGAALAGSLDQRTTLDKIARLATRELADMCILHLVEGEVLRPATVVHSDPAKEQLAQGVFRGIPMDPPPPRGPASVVRAGQPEMQADASDAAWAAEALGVEPPDALGGLGLHAYLCVPLTARGKSFGAMTLVSAAPGRTYGARDMWLAEELARRAALALENAGLYQEAQAAVRAQDEFLAIASHDLRGPLQTIQLQVHTLLGQLADAPGEPRAGVGAGLENVHKQVRRMVQMFDTLLDISRVTSGRLALDREQVDLSALVRECTERIAGEAAAAGCELRVRADTAVVGSWDRLRIEQVVMNLLSNALKYGKGGPIDVAVGLERATARLTVRDYGVGIPREHQARIFQRFERANGNRHVGGFGMGLWIVGRIIEAHGGSIHVDSQTGAGTTFAVDLPIAQ